MAAISTLTLMNERCFRKFYRLLFGLLTLVAVGVQFSVEFPKPNFNPVNFFSFFTILSNVLTAAIFIIGSARSTATPPSSNFDLWRGAVVLNMTLVGVVFSILLAGLDGLVLPWVNVVVHYVMPVVVLADWLMDPPSSRLTFRKAVLWLGFPLAYGSYVLTRGAFTNWYPYPFLSPTANGYGSVLAHCLVLFGSLVIAAWGIVTVGNALTARR